jgi:DNA-binding LacI/PurR family transcriptional regulator
LPERRVTSHEVAKLAGVSQSTVSLVLSGKPDTHISEPTRQRVVAAARQLDYHPNALGRSLARQQTRTIGLIVRESAEQMRVNAFLPSVLEGITCVAGGADFKLLVQPIADATPPSVYIKLMREAHVDGLIFSRANSADYHLIDLHPRNFPLVLWGQLPGVDLPFVDIDNVGSVRMAVEHLIALGHQRIGCITNRSPKQPGSEAVDRLHGYCSALEAHNIPVDESLIRHGNLDGQSGFEAMTALLAIPDRPSAVFVASDEVAFGALRAARSAGLIIPNDLAVVGFDDTPAGKHVTPPLTTVRVPARELGALAAQMLIEIIQTGTRPASRLLDTQLVVRESCGASRPPAPPTPPSPEEVRLSR